MRFILSLIMLLNGLFAAQVSQFDLQTGRLIPLSGGSSLFQQLANTFNPGESQVSCSLTREDIQKILSIIDDTQSYLEGVQNIFLQGVNPRKPNKADKFIPQELEIKRNEMMAALTVKLFIDNLVFVRNTVSYSLLDPSLKDRAFRQLVKEIRAINHWFDTNQNASTIMSSVTGNDYMETLQGIFSELRTYFPSGNLPFFGNMFAAVNGSTRVEEMDEVTTLKLKETIDILDAFFAKPMPKNLKPSQIAAFKEAKQRKYIKLYEDSIEKFWEVLTSEDPEIERLCQPIGHPSKWLNEQEYKKKLPSLDRPTQFKKTMKKVAPKIEVIAEPAPVKEKELPKTASTLAPSPIEKVFLPSVTAPSVVVPDLPKADSDVVEYFDPVAEHQMHQQRKAAAAVSSESEEEVEVPLSELITFLRESIYSQPSCSWRDFRRMMSRHGFEIVDTQKGNVRRVSRDGRYFTVHRPNDERAPLLYEYLSFIRSGLSHVFGLTQEVICA